MRVISGKYRSRTLLEVEDKATRSTKDRVKEALFNALYPVSHYQDVLDLFAGSGALGIEALSRGANKATFVEKSMNAYTILKKNLDRLNIHAHTYHQDALSFLKEENKSYDLILLDPPYNMTLIDQALKMIHDKKLLQEAGRVVLLSHKDESLGIPDAFNVIKSKPYGITNLKILEWRKS
ncbi:MAG: 16S rRNA (guanine(966)-N(2))-methyltransferase RsmD [Candidatus Izemoplasmataceae bacterium]